MLIIKKFGEECSNDRMTELDLDYFFMDSVKP